MAMCRRAEKFCSTFFEGGVVRVFIYLPARSGRAPGEWVARKEGTERNEWCETIPYRVVRNPPDSRLVEMDICILQSRISKDVDIIMHDFQNLTL